MPVRLISFPVVVEALRGVRVRRLAALFVLALAAACGGGEGNGAAAASGGRAGGPPPAMPVEMITLQPKPVEQSSDFIGTVKSRRSMTVQPQVEGFLTEILVKSGQRVAPGTTLFVIDSTTQQAAVAALQSQRASREADATYARQQATRAKSLLDVGAMSQQEYEQAIAQQKAAEAQLGAVDEQIRQQKAELAYYRVTAATTGIVSDVPVRVGDRVTRSTLLTTIDDNAGLEVYINVPVQQAPMLRVGLPVRILGETGEPIATERISFVDASVNDQTQTVLAKTPLVQRGAQFRSDQFVRVRVIWSTEPQITVPVVSVIRVSGQYFVYVAEPANGGLVAAQRSVTLGPTTGNEYVVTGGLAAGDRLITSGIQVIGPGAPVQPAGPAPPAGDAGRGSGAPGGR